MTTKQIAKDVIWMSQNTMPEAGQAEILKLWQLENGELTVAQRQKIYSQVAMMLTN